MKIQDFGRGDRIESERGEPSRFSVTDQSEALLTAKVWLLSMDRTTSLRGGCDGRKMHVGNCVLNWAQVHLFRLSSACGL